MSHCESAKKECCCKNTFNGPVSFNHVTDGEVKNIQQDRSISSTGNIGNVSTGDEHSGPMSATISSSTQNNRQESGKVPREKVESGDQTSVIHIHVTLSLDNMQEEQELLLKWNKDGMTVKNIGTKSGFSLQDIKEGCICLTFDLPQIIGSQLSEASLKGLLLEICDEVSSGSTNTEEINFDVTFTLEENIYSTLSSGATMNQIQNHDMNMTIWQNVGIFSLSDHINARAVHTGNSHSSEKGEIQGNEYTTSITFKAPNKNVAKDIKQELNTFETNTGLHIAFVDEYNEDEVDIAGLAEILRNDKEVKLNMFHESLDQSRESSVALVRFIPLNKLLKDNNVDVIISTSGMYIEYSNGNDSYDSSEGKENSSILSVQDTIATTISSNEDLDGETGVEVSSETCSSTHTSTEVSCQTDQTQEHHALSLEPDRKKLIFDLISADDDYYDIMSKDTRKDKVLEYDQTSPRATVNTPGITFHEILNRPPCFTLPVHTEPKHNRSYSVPTRLESIRRLNSSHEDELTDVLAQKTSDMPDYQLDYVQKKNVSLKPLTLDPCKIFCDVIICLWNKQNIEEGTHPLFDKIGNMDVSKSALLRDEVCETKGGKTNADLILHCKYDQVADRQIANALLRCVLYAEARKKTSIVLPVTCCADLTKNPRMATRVCIYVIDHLQTSSGYTQNLEKFLMCVDTSDTIRLCKEVFVSVTARKRRQEMSDEYRSNCLKCQRNRLSSCATQLFKRQESIPSNEDLNRETHVEVVTSSNSITPTEVSCQPDQHLDQASEQRFSSEHHQQMLNVGLIYERNDEDLAAEIKETLRKIMLTERRKGEVLDFKGRSSLINFSARHVSACSLILYVVPGDSSRDEEHNFMLEESIAIARGFHRLERPIFVPLYTEHSYTRTYRHPFFRGTKGIQWYSPSRDRDLKALMNLI